MVYSVKGFEDILGQNSTIIVCYQLLYTMYLCSCTCYSRLTGMKARLVRIIQSKQSKMFRNLSCYTFLKIFAADRLNRDGAIVGEGSLISTFV